MHPFYFVYYGWPTHTVSDHGGVLLSSVASYYSLIANGNFKLVCPKVRFVICPSYITTAFEGSGFISIKPGGFFEYECIVNALDKEYVLDLIAKPNTEESFFYQIQLWDEKGKKWVGGPTRPCLTSSFVCDSDDAFGVTGRVDSLVTWDIEDLVSNLEVDEKYEFIIPSAGSFPWTHRTTESIRRGKFGASSGTCRVNRHRFEIDRVDFSLEEHRTQDYLSVEISSTGKSLPPFVDIKTQEALMFISSRMLFPVVSLRYGKNHQSLRVHANGKRLLNRCPPPVRMIWPHETDRYWKAFHKYIDYMIKNDGDNALHHEFTETLIAIMEGGSRSPTIEALTLSVAIENILRLCSSLLPKPKTNEEKSADIDSLTKAKEEISILDVSPEIKRRVLGLLDLEKYNEVSSKKLLDDLAGQNLVKKRWVKSWGKIRHKSAHGANLSISKAIAMENHVDHLYMLAYELILNEIGFKGDGVPSEYTCDLETD